MKKYNFKLNGEDRGTITFGDSGITEINFIRPSDQYHFMSEQKLDNPSTIEDLVRSGYSMWDITEVK